MQMGGGCASGTLYTVGGGSVRMLLTLAAFVAGSALGAAHLHWWSALPHLPPISLVQLWGPVPAIAVNLAVFAGIAWLTVVLERRRHGRLVAPDAAPRQGLARLLRGPWPLVAGAVALALLNFATLALAGRPWGITSAFALWGSKAAALVGFDPASWPFWSSPAQRAALEGSVLQRRHLGDGFRHHLRRPAGLGAGRPLRARNGGCRCARPLAAVFGGLLLGYGARLAYGCNIGAYFSGIASGSLHGWVWMVAAFFGNVLGTRIRPALRAGGRAAAAPDGLLNRLSRAGVTMGGLPSHMMAETEG